jgi:hypothetical protein
MLLYTAKGKFPEDFYEQDYINQIPWMKGQQLKIFI